MNEMVNARFSEAVLGKNPYDKTCWKCEKGGPGYYAREISRMKSNFLFPPSFFCEGGGFFGRGRRGGVVLWGEKGGEGPSATL